ncbi:MAG TPA: hypothetical protein VH188_00820 [Chthoniobacterales bacterium]|jgi:hypothetical protein|nr:hypothetical protein [Chthoniobacterales bacterium]
MAHVLSFLRGKAALLGALAILAVYALEAHARNRVQSSPATLGDQSAYLAYARDLYESNYTVTADRNRMPVYPFLLSLIYRPGMNEAEFLLRAQTFTVYLSIVSLALLFLILRRFFPPLPALGLLAATAFGVFIYRAGKAQVELLFYFVSFCAFVLLLQLFVRPRWWLAVLAGATTGLAHLTKASVLPALGIWTVVFGTGIIWNRSPDRWRRLFVLGIVLASFLMVVFPYIQTSKRIYDSYFYNVNSTFVMWCDSSTEGYEFLKAHGDKDQWRQVPPDERPSARKYWREHTVAQIAHRMCKGSLGLITTHVRAIGYYKFVIALLVAGLTICLRQWHATRDVFAQNPFAAIFSLLFFGGYFALYAWYDQITTDTRFMLSIFLPCLFAASLFVVRAGRDRFFSLGEWQFSFEQIFGALFLALAMIDVVYNAASLVR